ncbi:MAG: phage tail tape measure protein [Sulfurospirillum sp.]|nr:phage tail tape measure protein [Sulfurospirillum sp.]
MASARDQSLSINMVMNSAINGANFLQVSVNKLHKYARTVEKINLLKQTKFPLLKRNLNSLENHLGKIRSQSAKISANPIRLDIKTSRNSLNGARKDMTAIEHDAKQVAFWTKKSSDNLRKGAIAQRKTMQKQASRSGVGTGAVFGAVTAGAVMTLPFKASIDFESSMADVKALTKNITAKDFTLLSEKARELGATTEFSATQAAQGMTYLAKAGFNTKQQLSAIGGVLGLATAGNVDLATSSDIASNILSGFNIKAEKMGMVSDVLAKTFTTSNTDLQMLGETMKYTAPIASGLGVGLTEVSALAGKLGDVGIQGSMAGTSLRQMYTRLSAPPKETEKALNALGVSIYDAKGKFKGMPNIIGELNQATKDLSNDAKNEKLKHIFGMTALSSGIALMKVGKKGLLDYQHTLDKSVGTTKSIQEIKLATTAGQFKLLSSAMEGLSISTTMGLLPTLNYITNALKGGAERLDKFTQKFPNASKWVFGLGSALIVGTLALAGFGFVASGLTMGLGVLASPVVAITLGISALAGAVYYLYNRFENVRIVLNNVWTGMKLGGALAIGVMSALVDVVKAVGNSIFDFVSPMLGLSDSFKVNSDTGTAFGMALTTIIPLLAVAKLLKFGTALGFISKAFLFMSKALLMNPIGLTLTAIAGAGYLIYKNWDYLKKSAGAIWSSIVTTIKTPFVSFFAWIDKKFKMILGVVDKVKNIGGAVSDTVKNKASNLWSGTKSLFGFGDDKKEKPQLAIPKLLKSPPVNNADYKSTLKSSSLQEINIQKLPLESVSDINTQAVNKQQTQLQNNSNSKNVTQNINQNINVTATDGKVDYEDLKEKMMRLNREMAHDDNDIAMRDVS